MVYDKIILGAGLYGLYSAEQCGKRGERILVLERDATPFRRATTINQARVHQGYHYPRSYSTAIKSAKYFDRFCKDYDFCILKDFDQVYATGAQFSWTDAAAFKKFCEAAKIRCDAVDVEKYFKRGMCDGAFLTTEYTYDAEILKNHLLKKLENLPTVEIRYSHKPDKIKRKSDVWQVTAGEITAETPFLLNATYAGVNDVHNMLGFEPFKIKYELCEMILCTVSDEFKNTGITVMDGPFFSIMPFGKTGLHSMSAVTFTPHQACFESLPTFDCQKNSEGLCKPGDLYNCNDCPVKPKSAWPYMNQLAKKYMNENYGFKYHSSLFSMKPILKASEIDDSRPTVIRRYTSEPTFISVLSGKINTVYDLDEVLKNG